MAEDLYYYGLRFYDPSLQRWINQDPIGEAGGINLYGFVSNDPINRFDPYGESDNNRPPVRLFPGRAPSYGPPRQEPILWLPILIGPPRQPIDVAREKIGSWDYSSRPSQFMLSPPNWWFQPQCNRFIADCISKCSTFPAPLIDDGEGGKRYPLAEEWANPNVSIPGFGPPHENPQPGDVVTDGNHLGFLGEEGFIEPPTLNGPVKVLPIGNPIWNPKIGRSPLK